MMPIPQSDSTLTVDQYESFTCVSQDDLDSSNTSNVSELTTEEIIKTLRDLRSLRTKNDGQYVKVNADGTLSFSHDRTFSISMPECSIPAYFESYAVLGDLSVYKSLALTNPSESSCSLDTDHYIRDAEVTFTQIKDCSLAVSPPPPPLPPSHRFVCSRGICPRGYRLCCMRCILWR